MWEGGLLEAGNTGSIPTPPTDRFINVNPEVHMNMITMMKTDQGGTYRVDLDLDMRTEQLSLDGSFLDPWPVRSQDNPVQVWKKRGYSQSELKCLRHPECSGSSKEVHRYCWIRVVDGTGHSK